MNELLNQYLTFQDIADEIGISIDTVRRNSKKLKLEITRRKTPKSRGTLVNCLSREDADKLKAFFDQRKNYDFEPSAGDVSVQRYGYFYLIQLVPEALPDRVKIGYTDNLKQRMSEYKTVAPTSKLIKSWECKRSWDQAAMDSITRSNCKYVLNEVYEGNIDGFIERGDQFFNNMPKSNDDIKLSDHSPLRKKGRI